MHVRRCPNDTGIILGFMLSIFVEFSTHHWMSANSNGVAFFDVSPSHYKRANIKPLLQSQYH